MNKDDIKKYVNDEQYEVCTLEDNVLLIACPGSGKTRTITYRLAYFSELYRDSKKLNIAITYTNRAADEIKDRIENLGIDISNIWTGTIHQFCMNFIIRPYYMYHKRTELGYSIIDEYVEKKYRREIAKKNGIKGNDNDFKKNKFITLVYEDFIKERKELDFDSILIVANELLNYNTFIAENISKVIRSINIDEYQDTHQEQYEIMAKIFKQNKEIKMLFAGDPNQGIYDDLGGISKSQHEIEELYEIDFKAKYLHGCYRSTNRIVEYYKNFEVEKTGVISVAGIKENRGIIAYQENILNDECYEKIANIIKNKISSGINAEEIAIVAPAWYIIYPMSNKLRLLLPDVEFDAPSVSVIKYDVLNIYFLIARILFTQDCVNRKYRKDDARNILEILRNEYKVNFEDEITIYDVLYSINSTKIIETDGIIILKKAINNLFQKLKIDINQYIKLKESYDNFFQNIDERIKKYELNKDFLSIKKCFKKGNGVVINTIHGIKGEEYNTVIAYNINKYTVPHYNYYHNYIITPKGIEQAKKLLYVLCSRAKEELYIFSNKRIDKR